MLDDNEDFLEDELTTDASVDDENSGLYEHLNIKVDKNQEPLRIDKFLLIHRQNSSRNKISQTCRAGNVVVNGNAVKQNYRVKPGDEISVLLAHPPRENVIIPQDIPINIVYEDADLVVVDKDAGMVVHPGFGNWDGTLVNALAFHFAKDPDYNSDLDRVGLVHRIDKDTSGLLVIAKNEYALSHLAKQFFDRKTRRLYWAFVWGNVQDDEGTIIGHIGRHPKNRMQMYTYADGSHGKHAVTHYKVLERFRYMTWVECKLETGRTHQIRAHMKHIGHTLFNDERYEGNIIMRGINLPKYKQFVQNVFEVLPRHALHAHTLGFIHPVTKKEMYFESPMPKDMQEASERWRKYLDNN
ncbi:RluA family pseudouridine synthase [Epilithonimonas arachidiradicis]|uniref:Pseudouridine synthase n=1 Tax=Epilithonimonas arachidiradicis TaxID=1617282 RepID=A0A420DAJ3_9FLAO|nr:RluA family pseudouridine synthase [Epilithonimonas arachidiradicis]RKE87776.1 23S rRNA pseudouridine1911/1915/1917 synthase [Epilithonimonas arachidiradicis]GGG57804.1 pseudouridine synthase [Epilithonimonas arachidiradicis]